MDKSITKQKPKKSNIMEFMQSKAKYVLTVKLVYKAF